MMDRVPGRLLHELQLKVMQWGRIRYGFPFYTSRVQHLRPHHENRKYAGMETLTFLRDGQPILWAPVPGL